jgi:hypothetical protein
LIRHGIKLANEFRDVAFGTGRSADARKRGDHFRGAFFNAARSSDLPRSRLDPSTNRAAFHELE